MHAEFPRFQGGMLRTPFRAGPIKPRLRHRCAPGRPPVHLTLRSRATRRFRSPPTPRGSSAPPPRAGPACARLLCGLCQSALLLPSDSAQSAAADRRFRRHSADLSAPRAPAGGPPPAVGIGCLQIERSKSSESSGAEYSQPACSNFLACALRSARCVDRIPACVELSALGLAFAERR